MRDFNITLKKQENIRISINQMNEIKIGRKKLREGKRVLYNFIHIVQY